MKKDWFENPILFGICYYTVVFLFVFVLYKIFPNLSYDWIGTIAEVLPIALLGVVVLFIVVKERIYDFLFELRMRKNNEKE